MQDWLETCHPDIRQVFHYWQGKCAGRPMPARGDIHPEELLRFLPRVILVDVVADARRYVYRLVGTEEVAVRGNDPTGKSVAESFFAPNAARAVANYDRVCRNRVPFHEYDNFQINDRYVGEENLFLPLSDDGETVNKIMVFSLNQSPMPGR